MSQPVIIGDATLYTGNNLDVLRTMPDCSVDSIVTDSPYGLSKEPDMAEVLRHWLAGDDYKHSGSGFMGKSWDSFVPGPAVWKECFRVLKPGGHLLSFFGSRTYDMGTLAIRLAGFEIRDQMMWIYASGMPKSFNMAREEGKKTCGCSGGALPYRHENKSQNMRGVRGALDAEGQVSGSAQSNVLGGVQELASEEGCGEQAEVGSGAQGQARGELFGMRNAVLAQCEMVGSRDAADVQPGVQRGATRCGMGEARAQGARCVDAGIECSVCAEDDGRAQSRMEGRRNGLQEKGQLQEHSVSASARMGEADGAQGWIPDGTSVSDGGVVRVPADATGVRSPSRSQPDEQPSQQSGTVAGQPIAQAGGTWPVCGGCGLPVVPKGLGTALKPAHEPICVARKPLVGTVAENVLQFGTGAINIDGCRVATDEVLSAGAGGLLSHVRDGKKYPNTRAGEASAEKSYAEEGGTNFAMKPGPRGGDPAGRWPANVILDGSDEVVALFPQDGRSTKPSGTGTAFAENRELTGYGLGNAKLTKHADHGGSAARFFYCAKASRKDRNEGCEHMERKPLNWSSGDANPGSFQSEGTDKTSQNNHPTVKPTELNRYLVRLVTPPGGTVLDPFMGSGSTGKACIFEGFKFIGIDMTPEYVAIAKARIEHAQSQWVQRELIA